MSSDLLWPAQDLLGLIGLMDRRDVSSREVLQAHIDRIEAFNDELKALVLLDTDRALSTAEAVDEARIRRDTDTPGLAGLPFAVKDIFDVEGLPTTAGTRVLASNQAQRDATSIARLRKAGVAIVGKTNLDELAFGGVSSNPLFGATRNPWDGESVAGGSSGGSGAAVAAGMCTAAAASDTGGSIRNPAAWCGVAGFKPTFGTIPTDGVIPQAWSLDTVGFIAHTVSDCALLYASTADDLHHDPAARQAFVNLAGAGWEGSRPRLGVARELFERCRVGVRSSFEHAAELMGGVAELVQVRLPELESALRTTVTIIISEAAAVWEPWLKSAPGLFGEPVRAPLQMGRLIRAVDYLGAQRTRRRLIEDVATSMAELDGLITPAMGLAPEPNALDKGESILEDPMWQCEAIYTCLWNLVGAPVLAMPCAFTDAGWPLAMQIVGHPGRDAELLRLARLAEHTWALDRASLVPTWLASRV